MTSLYFSQISKGFAGWPNMRIVTNNDCNCFSIKEMDASDKQLSHSASLLSQAICYCCFLECTKQHTIWGHLEVFKTFLHLECDGEGCTNSAFHPEMDLSCINDQCTFLFSFLSSDAGPDSIHNVLEFHGTSTSGHQHQPGLT